jgi:hypothetical protein
MIKRSSVIALALIIATIMLTSAQTVSATAASVCHNSTGSCRKHHFVCANEELVPHAKRCDGVEDCADGTDEYMCDQSPKPLAERSFAERHAVVETSCIACTCKKGSVTVSQSGDVSWWMMALNAPRDVRMLGNNAAAALSKKPCNPAAVTSIQLNLYKKQNKGCTGSVCCMRQEACLSCAGTGTPKSRCY